MNKESICAQVCRDLRLRGCTDNDIRYVRLVLSEEGYTDSRFKNIEQGGTTSALENLNQKIDNSRLSELLQSTDDAVPQIANYDLNFEQVNKLSPATKEEYMDERDRKVAAQKNLINQISSIQEQKREILGLKTKEDKAKESTQIPPKALWGVSTSYYYLKALAERHDTISKYLYDIAKQVYVFKPNKELDNEILNHLIEFKEKVSDPLSATCLIVADHQVNIMDNVQDEKNRDTFLAWLKKGVDKFWNYGNHGTGEVDFIRTGEYITELAPDNKTVIHTPIKREFTREQIGDKTTVEIAEEQNQLQIQCPECKLEFNKPIITDERRDLFAGDLFNKAVNVLMKDPLSKAMEAICDTVIGVSKVEEFVSNTLAKRGINRINLKDIKEQYNKDTKIKEEDIDPDDKGVRIDYNVMYGRAGRTHDKSLHFSNQA